MTPSAKTLPAFPGAWDSGPDRQGIPGSIEAVTGGPSIVLNLGEPAR
jgi:hypothetical protein